MSSNQRACPFCSVTLSLPQPLPERVMCPRCGQVIQITAAVKGAAGAPELLNEKTQLASQPGFPAGNPHQGYTPPGPIGVQPGAPAGPYAISTGPGALSNPPGGPRRGPAGWVVAGVLVLGLGLGGALAFMLLRDRGPKTAESSAPAAPHGPVLGNDIGKDGPTKDGPTKDNPDRTRQVSRVGVHDESDTNCTSLVFMPDGLWAVSKTAGGRVFLWDLKNRQVDHKWRLPPDNSQDRSPGVFAVSPDGKHIAASSAARLALFDPADGRSAKPPQPRVIVSTTLNTDRQRMVWSAAAFTPPAADGPWLAMAETGASDHGSVHITRVESLPRRPAGAPGEAPKILRLAEVPARTFPPFGAPVVSLAFSPDGAFLLAGGGKNLVDLWNIRDADVKRRFKGHDGMVTQVAFADPIKRQVYSASVADETLAERLPPGEKPHFDGTLRVWDNGDDAGEVVARESLRIEPGKEQNEFDPKKSAAVVTSAAFWPGGRAVTGHKDGSVAVWDLQTGKMLGWFPHQQFVDTKDTEVCAVACSPDGYHALAAIRDGQVCLYALPVPPGR
jgi:WD40 repeat protein